MCLEASLWFFVWQTCLALASGGVIPGAAADLLHPRTNFLH